MCINPKDSHVFQLLSQEKTLNGLGCYKKNYFHNYYTIFLCFWVFIQALSSAILAQEPSDLYCGIPDDDQLIIHSGISRSYPPWTNGIIAYEFDSTIVERTRDLCIQAFQKWEEGTPLRFPPRTTEENYLLVVDSGNSPSFSAVGMHGGRQRIYIAQPADLRNIMHELGHAIGLHHEHQRSDRDQYVIIHEENIGSIYGSNITRVLSTINYTPYDFLSIMHYPRNALSMNGKNTIVPREEYREYLFSMGIYYGISTLDKIGVTKIYSGIPALISPNDQADQQPHNGVILEWSTFPDAVSYQVQISKSNNFDALSINESVTAMSPEPPLAMGTQTYTTGSLEKGETYYWRISMVTQSESKPWSDPFSFQVAHYLLRQNYPNPFNPGTTIEFVLSRQSDVEVKILNLLGEEVETLLTENLEPGVHTVQWNASGHAAGIYLYWLRAGDVVEARKMVYIK